MLKRLRILSFLVVMFFALMSSGVVIAQGPPTDRPENPRAFPPFHVRGLAASSTPVNGYTPTQMRAAYGFDSLKADGAGQTIAIVDAYDDPTAASDLAVFSKEFQLPSMNTPDNSSACPHPCFRVVYASGSRPATDGGWALETSLDVQWAHAIAPGADIVLVEANDAYLSSLLTAVDVAVSRHASVVSMSWGAKDFYSESGYDSHFKVAGVSFVAASGDSGNGTIYPATSPFVLAVGGTTLQLDPSGTWLSETAWSGSGGGASKFEAEPGYQSSFPIPNTRGKRGSPDVAYNADPNTGVPVYDSTPYNGSSGWWQVGGTSAGAPQWAALIALADELRVSAKKTTMLSTNSLSSPFYTAAGSAKKFNPYGAYNDILAGSNGTCKTCYATAGYDFVTGLGSPRANVLAPFLAGQ